MALSKAARPEDWAVGELSGLCEVWVHSTGLIGGRATYTGAAKLRLRENGWRWPAEPGLEQKLSRMLENSRSKPTIGFQPKTMRPFLESGASPVFFSAVLMVAATVNKPLKWLAKSWNPVASWAAPRIDAKASELSAELVLEAHAAALGGATPSSSQARSLAHEAVEHRTKTEREAVRAALAALKTHADVVHELRKGAEPTAAALTIGATVGMLVWQHSMRVASIKAMDQHLGARGRSSELRSVLRSGGDLTRWTGKMKGKTGISRNDAAPMVATIWLANRDDCDFPGSVELRKVRPLPLCLPTLADRAFAVYM